MLDTEPSKQTSPKKDKFGIGNSEPSQGPKQLFDLAISNNHCNNHSLQKERYFVMWLKWTMNKNSSVMKWFPFVSWLLLLATLLFCLQLISLWWAAVWLHRTEKLQRNESTGNSCV
jgi:hypothetical protein